ncbi:50S ribosomal protein L6 [Candidatus Woesearchaeota archaeon]|nr:50S ribosomal protein L6 [Candidatus Woesearchaeota archaeon]
MKENLKREIVLEKGVISTYVHNVLKVKGPKGEVERMFAHPRLKIKVEGEKIILEALKATKREKTMIGSFEAHIVNMVKGVIEPHVYLLKVCSGHFPMTVTVSGQEFVIKNFLGEAVPRKVEIIKGVDVKVNGVEVIITSADKEKAGLMASRVENMCRITNRDRRIFQDGCYITKKAGKTEI